MVDSNKELQGELSELRKKLQCNSQPEMDMHILTGKELSDRLQLSPWTVRMMRLQCGLPHIQLGRRIFYRMETVMDWLQGLERSSITKADPAFIGVE